MMAPPVARDAAATLVDVRPAGHYRVLTVRAPEVVAQARPGQFVSVGVEAARTLLRRPFAIAGVDPGRSTFDVVVASVGHGSGWLALQHPGRALDVVGPLGRGFAVPATAVRCLLVGGGYGTAALEWLGERLADDGHEVELLSGAATASALYPVSRISGALLVETTEDGSRGRTGLVTAALTERLGHGAPAKIFACGPMPMLAAVAEIARLRGCDCQVAVEEHMGCSVGVCMTCVVPTVEGEGERQRAGGWGPEGEGERQRAGGWGPEGDGRGRGPVSYVRACIEGPVLNAERVDWESVRRRAARG